MILSILICSLQKRLVGLAPLIRELQIQSEGNPVEILWLGDNKKMTVGEKRNKLLSLATGDYVCFIDDDDWVADSYIDEILKALESKPDCVCFECLYTNAETAKENHVYFQHCNKSEDRDAEGIRIRMVNHLNPVKREIALKIGFPEKNFGEDSLYAINLWNSRMLQKSITIKKVLYFYRFNPGTSETHQFNPKWWKADKHEPMVKMDIVIVSDGTQLKQMTQDAVNSIAADNVNVIVVEKADTNIIRYEKADTIPQDNPFNYNQCLNKGARYGNSRYICFSNNDVIFPLNFVSDSIKEFERTGCDVMSFTNQSGYIHPEIISGYCFMMTRKAYEKIGHLNMDYEFWCADNVTSEQIKEHGLKEYKSPIIVKHLTSASLKMLPAEQQQVYTKQCVKRFNKKFNRNVLNMGV